MDEAPTWLRLLQAGVLGVVAGLALNALFAMTAVEGQGMDAKPAPKACKKKAPAKDAVAPAPDGPSLSSVTWTFVAGTRS
jgi:hypothetical protein